MNWREFSTCKKTTAQEVLAIVKSLSKVLHVLFKHPYKEKKGWQWVHHPEVNNIRFGFLKGYWQSEKYFSVLANSIRAKFTFPVLTDERNRAVQDAMANNDTVSMHIRRGDYLKPDMSCSLSIEYYLDAMALINERVSDPITSSFPTIYGQENT